MNREELIREKTAQRFSEIDREEIGNMSINEVKDRYNQIKAEVEKEVKVKDEIQDMFKETSTSNNKENKQK